MGSFPFRDASTLPDRRRFLALAAAGGLAATSGFVRTQTAKAPEAFELAEKTIDELQAGMKAGTYTARSLAEKYVSRIEAIDRAGPNLRSVLELNPDLLTLADELDRERRAKGPRGPMHGIPVLIKDNINTADRLATTAGSLALVGAKPAGDAFIVTQLRKAGALILGKSNLSEWANFRSSMSTSGWSARGGLTRNPYALDRNPCGSSSGSGVASSANLTAVAVGTETDGSITAPASVNGIVGIKPTVGLISRSGIIPISHSQDTAGPMARTVRDAAILLSVMAGVDAEDQVTGGNASHIAKDYTSFLAVNGLKGATIGVARNYFGFHDGVDTECEKALEILKKQGATLVEISSLPKSDQFGTAETTVFYYEMKAGLNAYLARLTKSPIRNLKELIAFNEKNAERELLYFGQDQLIKAEAKGDLESYEYLESLAKCRRLSRTEGLDAAVAKHKLDAIVAPTMGPASVTDLVVGDRWLGGDLITLAAIAGYPHITVPAGLTFGLPVGLSFVGPRWSEPTLLKLAYCFEQASQLRKPPSFLPSAKLM